MQESCKFGLYNDGVDTNEGERNDGETKATCDDKRIKRSPKRNEGKFCRRISGKPKELLVFSFRASQEAAKSLKRTV